LKALGHFKCRVMSIIHTWLRKRVTKIIAGLLLLIGILALWGAFSFSSVCSRCGATQHATMWQIPLTETTVFRTSSVSETPVSMALLRIGITSKHDHQWQFSQGSDNGVYCALGNGQRLWFIVRSEKVASLLEACHKFGETPFRDRLVRLMFDLKTTELVRQLGLSQPANGFANASEFRRWQADKMEFYDDLIMMYQQK
jgi:hypothetical protein